MILRLIPLLLLWASSSASFKILVYNVRFGHSHSNYMGRVADILAEAGHEVTSLIPIVDPSVSDGTTKSKIITIPQSPGTGRFLKEMHSRPTFEFWESDPTDIMGAFAVADIITGFFCDQCNATANHPGLIEKLNAENFDVFINENFDFCGAALAHAIAPKSLVIVSTSSLFDNVAYDLGIPVMPAFNPSFSSADLDIHSIWSRALNTLRTNMPVVQFGKAAACANDVFRSKFGPDYPDVKNQTGDAAYVFTNSEPFIDFARPLLRKVVDLGGIGLKEAKPLDEHWNKVLSLRSRTVLVSFGSMAKSVMMSEKRKHAMLQALAKFPDVTFIWKYEAPEDDFARQHVSKVKNVVLSKWTPQNDLLNDPRLTAFVSHAGAGSCQEAAARGVPGLFIPLFGDQPRNAAMMEHNGIGLAFNKYDAVDGEKIAAGIRRLLETESLRTNARRISAMLVKRPFSPRDQLVKHIEFAAEFGPAKALTPRGLELNWMQYFLVDIIAIALVTVALITVLISFVAYRVGWRFVSFVAYVAYGFWKIFVRPAKTKRS